MYSKAWGAIKRYWGIGVLTLVMLVGSFFWRLHCGGFDSDIEFTHTGYVMEHFDDGSVWMTHVSRTVGDAFDRYVECIHNDNARLAQLYTCVVETVCPRWLIALIHALVIAYLPIAILWIGGGRKAMGRPMIVAFVYLCYLLFPSWNAHMDVTAFFANYFITAVWLLTAIALALRTRHSIGRDIALFACTLLAAAWHEEGAAMATAFFGMYVLLRPRQWRWWALAALSLAVMVVGVSISHGTMRRAVAYEQVPWQEYAQWFTHYSVLADCAMFMICIALIAVFALNGQRRQRVSWLCVDTLGVTAVAGILVGWATLYRDRVFMMPILLCIAIIVALFTTTQPRWRAAGNAVATLLAAVIAILLYHVAAWQTRIRANQEYTNNRYYMAGQSPVVFADTMGYYNVPWQVAGFLNRSIAYGQDISASRQQPKLSWEHVLLPERFAGKRYSDWPVVPGNTDFHGTTEVLVLNQNRGTISAVLHCGATVMPAQAPWHTLMRRLMYGDTQHTQLHVYLEPKFVGLYPVGAPDADSLFLYEYGKRGMSTRAVVVDSVTFLNP